MDVKDLLQNPKNGSKNHFICTCLWCGKENHMYIHKGFNSKGIENAFDCKKCGVKGNIVTLLIKLDKLYLLDGRDVDVDQPIRLSLKSSQSSSKLDIDIKDMKLPIGFKEVRKGDKFYDYLISRKFQEIDFYLYQPGYTNLKQKLVDYVIIPVYRDYKTKGYVSRYIYEDEDKERYLNSQSEFSKLLFGLDEVHSDTRTAILVEGIFDKISVTTELGLHYNNEMKCFCTFGKKLSEIQIYLLLKAGIENLIIMYDGRDAVNDMKKISAEVESQFKSVLVCFTGINDPGNSNKNQILQYIKNAEKPEKFRLSKLNKLKLK